MRMAIVVGLLLVAGSVHAQDDAALMEATKQTVTKDFKDPDSAQFRNVHITAEPPGKYGRTVCGEVNGKNSHGGYVGYKQFYRFELTSQVVTKGDPIMDKLVDLVCKPGS